MWETPMKNLYLTILTPTDATMLSELLATDDIDYKKFFIPFSTDIKSLENRLASVREDRYWGVWLDSTLAGFFMMRGFDEGYKRPSFGIYIARAFSRKGLSRFALDFCISWCRLNNIESMILKVHHDNCYVRKTYELAGFTAIGVCPQTRHIIMEKCWRKA
jgi:RimJ/RimL family protein N-acetyltransferase